MTSTRLPNCSSILDVEMVLSQGTMYCEYGPNALKIPMVVPMASGFNLSPHVQSGRGLRADPNTRTQNVCHSQFHRVGTVFDGDGAMSSDHAL